MGGESERAHTFEGLLTSCTSPPGKIVFQRNTHTDASALPRIKPQGKISKIKIKAKSLIEKKDENKICAAGLRAFVV